MPMPLMAGMGRGLAEARSVVSSFTPADLAGLQLWFRASDITGLVDGDPVATWSDTSGNARDMTQSTASKRPTWRTAVLNGKAVVRFDGSDDYLSVTSAYTLIAQPFSVFAVVKANSTNTVDRLFDDSNDGSRSLMGGDAAGAYQMYAGGSVLTGGTRNTSWVVWEGQFNGASSKLIVASLTVITGDPGSQGNNQIFVGCDYAGLEPWDGDMAELFVVNSVLSASDQDKVMDYFLAQYGI